ncbi:phage tail domain-containing protein [Acetivibrio ethanolgignens]|uniref:Prophage tail endopeptidase domain-containing protein n=1 Tax=Acetivibrio ethanolgignens TaxID=290052 RepID=A0A0V8QFQ5_9FIRM|nr:phage tail domain-containing protein [Acetivibrio ethanolgignens]KSV59290.1 hypothetical protein ASU35_09445 [Acetivibrio ethanolgignens]
MRKIFDRFIFDGKSSDVYDVVAVFFDRKPDTSYSAGLKTDLSTFANKATGTFDIVEQNYSEPMKFTLQIVNKDFTDFDTIKEREIKKWLCKRGKYCWFSIETEGYENIQWQINISNPKVLYVGRVVGMEFECTANAPFGYSPLITRKFEITDNNKSASIHVNTDEDDYIYPHIEISMIGYGNLSIINSTEIEHRDFLLNNVTSNEVITIDNSLPIIGSSQNGHNIYSDAQIEESSDDIYTVMTVSGGDYDGNPLQITDVNPTGTSYICNFNYYYPWFSDELKVKITEFNKACAKRKGGYTTAISTLKELMLKLEDINNRVPKTEHSTDWSEYGVIELQSEFNYYNQKMSVYLDGQNESKRMEYYNILYGTNGIQNALTQRKSEYAAKEAEIAHQQEIINNYVLNMEEFLGNELYKELSSYFYYTTFTDDTFVATRAMDDSEILEMKLALLEEAERKLAEVSHPSYTMTIDSENFLALPKYKEYAEQLSLGCMVSVEFEEDEIITPRLLKISIDWEDLKNFTLTFSSKTKLDDGLIQLEEIHKQINTTVTSQILSGIGWDAAKNQITPVNEFMNSALDASKNALFSGKNQEVITDGSGMRLRKWVDELNNYSPNQMWETNNGIYLTDSAWESVNVAIGELNIGKDTKGNDITMYGIAAPLLLGKMTISESLYIMNQNNSFSINNDGLLALSQNKNTAIKINPNNNSGLIEIVKGYGTSSAKSVFYTDSSGNLNLTGTINANSGTIGGWTIDSNGLSGGGTISGGEITGSMLFSQNYFLRDAEGKLIYDSSHRPKKSGMGTMVNLETGYSVFSGKYRYAWLDEDEEEHDASITMDNGRIRIRDENESGSLYYSYEGISTTKDGNEASGIIDFKSKVFGESKKGNVYKGITIKTRNSPLGLISDGNHVIVSPNKNQALYDPSDKNMFDKFTFATRNRFDTNAKGEIDYGKKISDGGGILYYGKRKYNESEDRYEHSVGLELSTESTVYIVDGLGRRGEGYLVAKNIPKPVKSMSVSDKEFSFETKDGTGTYALTKDSSGRITKMDDGNGNTIKITWR